MEEDGRGRRSNEGCSSSNFWRGEGGGKGEGGYQTHHMTKIFVGGGKERGRRREDLDRREEKKGFSQRRRGESWVSGGKAEALSCFEKVRGGLFGCFLGEEGE